MPEPKKGFTLIELLVVIAIIALLMSIMMPALAMVKKHTRFIVCRSNLRQYGFAGRMYLDENNSRFPNTLVWLYSNMPSGYCMWHDKANNLSKHPENAGVLWPYLKAKDVHLCPSFRIACKLRGCSNPNHTSSIPIEPQYSYSMNAFLGGDGAGAVSIESQVVRPDQTFFFSEENSWTIPGLSCSGCGINDNNLRIGIPDDIVDCFATYHIASDSALNEGRANIVFLDCHLDTIKAEDQYNGANFELAWPRSKSEIP